MSAYACPIRAPGIYVRIRRYDYCWCKGCEAVAKAAALFAWPREKYEVLHRLVDPKQRKGLRVAYISTPHVVAMMWRENYKACSKALDECFARGDALRGGGEVSGFVARIPAPPAAEQRRVQSLAEALLASRETLPWSLLPNTLPFLPSRCISWRPAHCNSAAA